MPSAGYIKLFGNFEYFGSVVTDQNYIHKEIKSMINSSYTYHSF